MTTRVTRASLRAAQTAAQDPDPPDAHPGSPLVLAGAITVLHLLPGTIMLSAGAVDNVHITNTPNITGTIIMPAVVIGWAMVSFLLIPVIQMAVRNPIKPFLAVAATLTLTTAIGLSITTAAAEAEKANLESYINNTFNQAITTYGTSYDTDSEVDNIQEAFKCCGADSYHDYTRAKNSLHGAVPASCCHGDVICPHPPIRMGKTPGCKQDLIKAITEAMTKEQITMGFSAALMGVKGILLLIGWAATATPPAAE